MDSSGDERENDSHAPVPTQGHEDHTSTEDVWSFK